MYIPPLYHDEHVLGWRGKIKFHNHFPTANITIDQIKHYLSRNRFSDASLEKRTSQLVILANLSNISPIDFAYAHSFLPFVKAFSPNARESTDDIQKMQSILRHWGQPAKDGAWFCVTCAREDQVVHGIPYWRRAHQLIGVNWCHIHQHKLHAFLCKDAFDIAPPIYRLEECFVPDGPNSLQDTNPIIQRYITIAINLLGRNVPSDLRKTIKLLREQYAAVSYNKRHHHTNLVKEIELNIPEYWRTQFLSLRTKIQGDDIFNFQKLLNQTHKSFDTERYIMAFAFLFESSNAALLNLDQSQMLSLENDNFKLEKKTHWWREEILTDYIKSHGCHISFSSKKGLDTGLVSSALDEHGLPNLGTASRQKKAAIEAFFGGESLCEISQKYQVNTIEVENVLRVAGVRLATAFKKMDSSN